MCSVGRKPSQPVSNRLICTQRTEDTQRRTGVEVVRGEYVKEAIDYPRTQYSRDPDSLGDHFPGSAGVDSATVQQ